jgi:hypothetical protein
VARYSIRTRAPWSIASPLRIRWLSRSLDGHQDLWEVLTTKHPGNARKVRNLAQCPPSLNHAPQGNSDSSMTRWLSDENSSRQ